MKTLERKTLAQIVITQPAAAKVFEKFNFDYCCHGTQSLLEACTFDEKKYKNVISELEQVSAQYVPDDASFQFEKMSLADLIDSRLLKDHEYFKSTLPRIKEYLNKIESKHGLRHPELIKIVQLFDRLSVEMKNHMFKEEEIVFPRIKIIEEAFHSENEFPLSKNMRMISSPIEVMEREHESAGNIVAAIRTLSNNYTTPANTCNTFLVTYHELKKFEHCIHQHVHLENNILYPEVNMIMDKLIAVTSI